MANVPILTIVGKQEPDIKQADVVIEHNSTSENTDDKENTETH
jgi:hypothetical protein